MSRPGIILARSFLDDVTITASSEASDDLAIENVQNDQPSEPWRSDGAGVHTWEWNAGSPEPFDTLVLYPTNMDINDTVKFEYAKDAAFTQELFTYECPGRYPMYGWGEQPLDIGPVGGDDDNVYQAPFVVECFDLKTRPYGRITFTRQSGYTEVGRAMLGYSWEPSTNYDWGISVGRVDPSTITKSVGGQMRVVKRPKYLRGFINWSWLDDFGVGVWDDIIHKVGKGNTVCVIPDPDNLNKTIGRRQVLLCRIVDHTEPRLEEHSWVASMQIEEAL